MRINFGKKVESGNRKIFLLKKKVWKDKEKIKREKRNIRKVKKEKFKNTKVGNFLNNIFSFFRIDKDTYTFSEVLIVTLISLVVGAFACFSVFMVMADGRNYFKLSKELSKFVEVYDTIIDNYYNEVDKEELINEAIDGMVSSVGDLYTNYVDASSADEFDALVGGVYEGIGCTIQLTENGVIIYDVYPDGPSFKAGLKSGDIILKVDDKDATKMNSDEISSYIRTESSDKIKIIVLRDGEEKEFILTRGKVETPVVNSLVYEKNGKKIGYLKISIFSSVAFKQFKNKLETLEKQNIDSLIIDVRNNNGGYLSAVTNIASELLLKGKTIYQVEKDGKRSATNDKTSTSRKYPVAILVNEASASASEILAASIKESYGGYVVGVTTYGKGTVQQAKKLSDGSMIKYTVENWLTPNGNWMDGIGIEPTHKIELSSNYYDDPTVENDAQLQKALELVSE